MLAKLTFFTGHHCIWFKRSSYLCLISGCIYLKKSFLSQQKVLQIIVIISCIIHNSKYFFFVNIVCVLHNMSKSSPPYILLWYVSFSLWRKKSLTQISWGNIYLSCKQQKHTTLYGPSKFLDLLASPNAHQRPAKRHGWAGHK